VIFASNRAGDDHGYEAMADEMDRLARAQPGCLGAESARGPDGFGITVSYWTDEASIAAWKAEARHLVAQRLGRERWYVDYAVRVAKVERAYFGPQGR
jgi:heme-degrading monooxygenase HmoA